MSVNNGIVTPPIVLGEVASLLGCKEDVATVCTSPNINRWAKFKPYRRAAVVTSAQTLGFASPSEYITAQIERNYGIGATGLGSAMGWEAIIAGDNYPDITTGLTPIDTDPKRLGDFVGYNHLAEVPIIIENGDVASLSDGVIYGVDRSIRAVGATPVSVDGESIETQITIVDLFGTNSSNRYLCAILVPPDYNPLYTENTAEPLVWTSESPITAGTTYTVPIYKDETLMGDHAGTWEIYYCATNHTVSGVLGVTGQTTDPNGKNYKPYMKMSDFIVNNISDIFYHLPFESFAQSHESLLVESAPASLYTVRVTPTVTTTKSSGIITDYSVAFHFTIPSDLPTDLSPDLTFTLAGVKLSDNIGHNASSSSQKTYKISGNVLSKFEGQATVTLQKWICNTCGNQWILDSGLTPMECPSCGTTGNLAKSGAPYSSTEGNYSIVLSDPALTMSDLQNLPLSVGETVTPYLVVSSDVQAMMTTQHIELVCESVTVS